MPVNFLIGQIMMMIAAPWIQKSDKAFTRPLTLLMIYVIFIFVPVTGWHYLNHMSWQTVYLRPPEQIPTWAGAYFAFTFVLGMFLGALLAQTLIQKRRKKIVFFTMGLTLVWIVGIVLLTLNEYSHVGTFAEFHSGAATSLFESTEFMKELNISGVLLGLPLIGLAFYFRKKSKPEVWQRAI